MYLFERRKGGQSFKKALKDLSPHAYYKIYLEPLFKALEQAGAFHDDTDEDYILNDFNEKILNR